MAIEKITMPQLGESVTEGTISSWLVKVGDQVNKYDPIAEVMTDKVNAEVPSSFTGTIKELSVQEGDTVSVGELICHIETDSTDSPTNPENESMGEIENPETTNQITTGEKKMKQRYSPAVLRLAQENDVDLAQINGSGRGGRITRKDIEKVLASGSASTTPNLPISAASLESTKPSQPNTSVSSTQPTQAGDIEIPVAGVRKVIAQNMVRSKTEIPHAWMTVEVDVTNLVNYRNKIKTEFKQNEGYNLTYFAFFVKAVAQGLKKFPQLNSMWAGDKIIQRKDINLSIAVAKDQELFVPVIKNADEKSIKGIAREIHELAQKARSNKLTANDMQGGTLTVNNTGSFGSVHSMGVINYPQAAILQVESIVKRPVIIDNMFAARDMVNLCLSLDHRILDGLICGQFLAYVKETLENMSEGTVEVY